MQCVDDGGIEALSMRKLGQSLGVEAMSLYNHVANKDDILNSLVDLVMLEIQQPSAEQDWEAALRSFAISAHEAFLRHPWACNLIMSPARVSPERLRYMEFILGRLRDGGFSAEATYHGYHALDSHILGFTLWQLGHAIAGEGPSIATKEDLEDFLRALLPRFRLVDYPHLVEHAEQHLTEGSHKNEGEFEFGLRLILEGLRRMRTAT
jgi:AcrR family transcriptional regulator